MRGVAGDRMNGLNGLTDGMSSRYLHSNRSALSVPSLYRMRQSQEERNVLLHGRLEELLVFEILRDGETDYHRFSARSLHKYVLKAIKTGTVDNSNGAEPGIRRSSRNMLDQFALGRAIVNGASPTNTKAADNTTTSNQTPGISMDSGLGPIDETVPLDDLPVPDSAEKADSSTGGPVTYRERLGGFLHPRDMRRLVSPFSASNEPELIVRRHAMLLNFDPLRAIILRDRVLVLVPDGADSLLVDLEKRIRGGTQGEHGFSNSMTASESTPSLAKEETNAETTTEVTEQLNEEGDGDSEYGDAEFVSSFIDNEWEELEGKDWIDLPFELQSVDAVLHSVGTILADDVLDLQHAANGMIGELLNPNADVGDHAQEVLRTMKNSIKEMMSRVDGFCRALDTVLEDYEDMALMNLSRLLSHPERFVQPVPQGVLEEESDEPELILEAQLQRGHTLTNALALVEGQISSTEDFAVRKSDTIRNRLLYINMVISVLSLSVAIGSFIGSIFGMNVINRYEDSANAFRVIVLSTVGGALFFILASLGLIRWLGALPNLF